MTLPSNGQTTIKPNNMNLNISEEKKNNQKEQKKQRCFPNHGFGEALDTLSTVADSARDPALGNTESTQPQRMYGSGPHTSKGALNR